MRSALPFFRASAFSALALAAGCSLVNSLEDLTPADDGTFTTAPRPDSGGLAVDAAGSGSSDAEAGTSEHALLVVGGEVANDSGLLSPVLTVLDAKTGRELGTRESFWVAGVAHDAVRDLWYVFEAPSYFVAGSADVVELHIRRLDAATGAWTELSKISLPPLVYYDAIAVTNERLSFVAHPVEGGSSFRMVTLDTSNPAAPTTLADQTIPQLPRGMLATRSASGPGGSVNLLNTGSTTSSIGDDGGAVVTSDCQDGGCSAKIRRYLIPNQGAPAAIGISNFGEMSQFGQPAYGSVICKGTPDDVVILPTVSGVQSVHTLGYLSSNPTSTPLTFTMSTATGGPVLLRRAAIDNTRRLAFVVEANNDTSVYAVSLDNGEAVKGALRHSGQAVYYDPGSETVFAPFNQGAGATFSPFRVTGSGATAALVERGPADWNPPSDLRPLILGIRGRATEICQ